MARPKASRKVARSVRSVAKRAAKRAHTHGLMFKIKRKTIRKSQKRAYRIVGRTTDGVVILRAKVKPKHFTPRQIRSTINQVEKAYQIRA